MKPLKVVASCGGTGGHIYPAIAIAQTLADADVIFLGSSDRLDRETIQRYGFSFVSVGTSRGNPVKMIPAFFRAVGYLWAHRPHVVICTGGKITAATGIAATLLRIPLVVMEQNCIAGRTNRLLARVAKAVVTAFPNTVGLPSAIPLGNPVRRHFLRDVWLVDALALLPSTGRVVLVFGGSQGASALNQAIDTVWETDRFTNGSIIHILGPAAYDAAGLKGPYQMDKKPGGIRLRIRYAEEMDTLYRRADVVVCRAGATSIAELIHFRVPAVLVPYPFAMDDHQAANAQWMADATGASVVAESALSPESLVTALVHQMGRPYPLDLGTDVCARIQHLLVSIVSR